MSFNTSTRKEDVSLKLRAVNLHKARDETKQLEEESRKMEERLKELKMAMMREKEERERAQSGFWTKGKEGALTGYVQEVLAKPKVKAQKPKKIKVLTDEPIVPPVRAKVPGTLGFIAKRGSSDKENRIHGPKCGQCEQKAAQVSCLECGEEYCASCFAAFHLRGNLKKHRSVPVGTKVSRTPRGTITPRKPATMSDKPKSHSNGKHVMFSENSTFSPERMPPQPVQNGADSSLLDGEYNEVESAASFQRALKEWRSDDGDATKQQINHQPVSPVRSPVVSIEHGTSTESQPGQKVPEITFHSSLNYAEKLMLKRHRRTELQPLPDDIRSRSETGSQSSEYELSELMTSSRTEMNGQEISEETVVQVLSQPREEENDGIHWQDIHRAMKSDSIIECDSRSESRLSIIELEDEQPVKLHRRGRHANASEQSTYDVTEVGSEEDMEILTARKQSARSARRTRSGHKSSSSTKMNNANHQSSADVSRQVSGKSIRPAAQSLKAQKEVQPTDSRERADGDVTERKRRPSSRPKSRTQPQSSRPKSSRTDQSRPHSRAMSRAETRLALFGDGELTKKPSEALKEVSQMTPRHDPVPFLPTMGEFFIFGSDISEGQVRSRVMLSADSKTEKVDGKDSSIPKWKVSYNLYNMGPRSWKPEKSLREQVADSEAAEIAEDVSEKLQIFLAPDNDDNMEQGAEAFSTNLFAAGNEVMTTGRSDYSDVQRSRPLSSSHHMSEMSKQDTPGEPSSNSHHNEHQMKEAPKPMTPNSTRSRAHDDKEQFTEAPKPVMRSDLRSRSHISEHQQSKPVTPTVLTRDRTTPRRAVSRGDTGTPLRPESRTIVVDGDDLTSYDFEESIREQDADDEKSWYQLEWELASQDGRITEDGKMSRLSMLDPESDDPINMEHEQNDESMDLLQQNSGHLSPGASLDLRMNNLMEDFEEMEQKMNDEEDVKALTS